MYIKIIFRETKRIWLLIEGFNLGRLLLSGIPNMFVKSGKIGKKYSEI